MSKLTVETTQWIDEFSNVMARETYNLLMNQRKPEHVGRSLLLTFLARLIGTAVWEGFKKSSETEGTQSDVVDAAAELKLQLQEAVSTGYTAAMKKISGRDDVEFYCQIKVVPAPVNKEPC